MKKLSILMVALVALTASQAFGQIMLNFDGGVVPAGVTLLGNAEVRADDGNPGGYLKITDAANGERGAVIFPDLGGSLTSLNIQADLRVGGGTDSPADGFSFNFVRPDDPVLQDPLGDGFAGTMDVGGTEMNLPEEGSQTGLGIGFDEWVSGDGDLIGMSVRVDGVLVGQAELPTANGALDDITSLQTGDRGPGGPGDTSALGWAPFEINLSADKVLTINWKNNTVFSEAVDIEPFAGQLVFAGRTGGANAAHHIDNIAIVPEPSSIMLALTGLLGVLGLGRRRVR